MVSPNHVCYRKHKIINDLDAEEEIEDISESVEELREKLAHVKKMMEEQSGYTLGDIAAKNERLRTDLIDGNFLSLIFSVVFVVVVGASVYAFYNLYVAVLRKFPSHHTEL
ncbi:uncharacterized protein [Fopius arisanus]|uniref:TyrS_6 protein n=1 Tax=Fopius arisanus TaxID=64838 RepID=A0A0C9QWY8_9HYME|nr:PREDICTED: uncharacterized protein LOC105265685 [Fopius arisanus]